MLIYTRISPSILQYRNKIYLGRLLLLNSCFSCLILCETICRYTEKALAKGSHYHYHVYLSVCLHGTACLFLDRFSWNFILGFLLNFFCLFWVLLKSGKNNRHCTWRSIYIYVIVVFSGAKCVFHDVWTVTKETVLDLKITTKIFFVLCEVWVETE